MSTRGEASATAAEHRPTERVRLRVLYDFEYETRGKRIQIIKDEKLLLLRKTNQDWWQVVRPVDVSNFFVPEQATFYVPTGYVLQEDPLPESTRFYIDKDAMFKSTENTQEKVTMPQHSINPQVPHLDHKSQDFSIAKEESRKPHDSFRSVIRKLSGNLANTHDINKSTKPNKPSKIMKSLRKNSGDSNDDGKSSKSNLGIVPAKYKDTWENSAFGMCFGRDTKVNDVQVLNPFQEELESALFNRVSQRKATSDSLEAKTKHLDEIVNEKEVCSKFESIQDKWEKASSSVLKKPNNSQLPVSFLKIKDSEKKTSAPPNVVLTEMSDSVSCGKKTLLECEKLYSVIEKNVKKPVQQLDKHNNTEEESINRLDESLNSKMKQIQILDRKLVDHDSRSVDKLMNKSVGMMNENLSNCNKNENSIVVKALSTEKISKELREKNEMDKFLINDKRKMWAIERLMSELMESATNNKTTSNEANNESVVSGANKLAQELHEMSVLRRFENAEIQVNLLEEDSKEKEEKSNCELEKGRKKMFEFPRSGIVKVPKSPTARSPKLLDEYNEANILNDNEKAMSEKVKKYEDSPSYSNISLRRKKGEKEKVGENVSKGEMRKLKMPRKEYREELQLTPSLEKLASEIKFLPSKAMLLSSNGNISDVESADWAGLVALSQDSLRLYKRYSKSDGALNKREAAAGQRGSVTSQSQWQLQSNIEEPVKHQSHERKYAQQRCNVKSQEVAHDQCSGCYRAERPSQTVRYKLNRKSRSLGDLDYSDIECEKQQDVPAHLDSRRRYKPVPKLRSKESLRRVEHTEQAPLVAASEKRKEDSLVKPVPAKRRMQASMQQSTDDSLDDLSEIDIERSTAVGFKMLLRTSDSGSEEYLQYKSFPDSNPKIHQLLSPNENNVNELNRSTSSNSCSSASPSRLLDHDSSLENLVTLPPGWTQSYDNNARRLCFLNDRGDKWFSSSDSEGKIYFFEENSNQSSWALPTVIHENRVRNLSNSDWPQLFDGNMCILKEGLINKTKITTENGKKLKKAWSSSYAVLTELFLLLFKDAKTFAAMKMDPSAAAKPDISVDLNGAFIESAEKLSNRKNVYLLNTLLGLQVLIQSDNALVIQDWYREIHDAIQKLPFSQEYGRISTSRE